MPQILLTSFNLQDRTFSLDGDEAHHVIHVLRKKAGDVLELFDGNGCQMTGEIVVVDEDDIRITGRILKVFTPVSSKVFIRLIQGLPRGSKFDFVVEKAVELGANAILPFLSQKNLIQLNDDQIRKKQSRWQALSKAAAKQCGRAQVPPIEALARWADLKSVLMKDGAISFVLHPSGPLSLKEFLKGKMNVGSILNIVVGPESGFSPEETREWESWGIPTVSLGSAILRSETAGLAVLSILNYEFNLL